MADPEGESTGTNPSLVKPWIQLYRCNRLRCPPACKFPIRVIITPSRFTPWPLWPMLKHRRPDNPARGHLSLIHRSISAMLMLTLVYTPMYRCISFVTELHLGGYILTRSIYGILEQVYSPRTTDLLLLCTISLFLFLYYRHSMISI